MGTWWVEEEEEEEEEELPGYPQLTLTLQSVSQIWSSM